jgi:hypothetical protein
MTEMKFYFLNIRDVQNNDDLLNEVDHIDKTALLLFIFDQIEVIFFFLSLIKRIISFVELSFINRKLICWFDWCHIKNRRWRSWFEHVKQERTIYRWCVTWRSNKRQFHVTIDLFNIVSFQIYMILDFIDHCSSF